MADHAEEYVAWTSVQFKDETVLGFRGAFSVNFRIPPLLGLGKSVSRGFGIVRPVTKKKAPK